MTDVIPLGTRLCNRVRVHWPAAVCSEVVGGPTAVGVRVHVVDVLWLELRSPVTAEKPWVVMPVLVEAGNAVEVANAHPYGIGVMAQTQPDDVADRFYEEIRFWWTEYEDLATRVASV